jgi:hypothetical protein
MAESAIRPQGRARGAEILRIAGRDRAAAVVALRALSLQEQAAACEELRPELRSRFLLLLDAPEEVVPLLAETELCVTIRATGMSEAAWLLELATAEQRQACFDLDCWSNGRLELDRVTEWIDALCEAGRPTLVAALGQVDAEIGVLALAAFAEVTIVSKEDDPPEGAFTEDGVVYFRPRDEASFARVREIALATFSEDQPAYWRLVYGVLHESRAEAEEWARRWHEGRLADLGFPAREQAMQLYSPLRVDNLPALPESPAARPERAGELVASGELPAELTGTLVGEALRELSGGEAAQALAGVLAVANGVAVADRLRLSDADAIPAALRKAVRGIDRGLREVVAARRVTAPIALEQIHPRELFRVGAAADGLRPRSLSPGELEALVGGGDGGESAA